MRDAKKAKVLEAAQGVFFRYGYRRTTMGDLAAAAGLSRPALYLLFCNKEEVFRGVLGAFTARTLDDLRQALPSLPTPEEKLRTAFELWAVRPFTLFAAAPDAKDLVDCGFDFARGTVEEATAAFEAELAAILAPLWAAASVRSLPPDQIARVLTRAVHGFKESAATPDDLRTMISGLVEMVLGSLRPASST
ncbi:TetR/AcrR family transcriptional regulator [Geothrix sp. 21YS21S-4]|uniref:TetR/AcrR family transcriptional regulator n=1 Tax=Geothrix sp. 21YS21S-4 TaxID=3068889 RepID=UPI0027BA60E8|nr:TetR/AcrR family transcriptional regulator [Geothrix sp. 21YS21S-4]